MIPVILEAAFRSLLLAAAVWAGIRMMRMQAVLAQKLAWVLVLLAAGAMPFMMRAPIPFTVSVVRIPAGAVLTAAMQRAAAAIRPLIDNLRLAMQMSATIGARTAGSTVSGAATAPARTEAYLPKPRAAHPATSTGASENSFAANGSMLAPGDSRFDTSVWSAGSRSLIAASPRTASAVSKSSTSLGTWLRLRAAALLTLAYLSVAAFLMFRTLAGLAVALRLWLRSTPVPELRSLYLEGQARAGSVRASRDLVTPVTIGSAVILPANYSEWDEDKLRVVLAHERSHVRQGDFYLQLLAAAHVAIFWFSPLGWWLRRKLSELGEALSDRAGLEAAPDATAYAQVLLEFAAMPRTAPIVGVPMARRGSLATRIDRILNISRLRPAFAGGPRHVVLSASLVLAALVAVVACIRIVPPVEAAQAQAAAKQKAASGSVSGAISTGQSQPATEQSLTSPDSEDAFARQVSAEDEAALATSDDAAPQLPTPSSPVVVPPAPSSQDAPTPMAVEPPEPLATPEPSDPEAPIAPLAPQAPAPGNFAYGFSSDDDGNSFAIIRGNGNVTLSGHSGKALEEAKRKYHNNFIWFERDGKSYVITDPSVIAQFSGYDARNRNLEREQARLRAQQDMLSERMKQFDPSKARVMLDNPEMKRQMAELNARLAELQSEKFKKMTEDLNRQVNQEMLANLQARMGEIQEQIGEMQGRIGDAMGRLGEKQGELGEQMGRLGEQMGRIGEEQGRIADEMNQKVQSLIDRALQNGTAKPVN